MPRATPEHSLQKNNSLIGNTALLPADQFPLDLEHVPSGKAKKSGKKARGKTAVKTPPEDQLTGSPLPSVDASPPLDFTANIRTSHEVASPVLDALSSLDANHEQDADYRTNTWAKAISFGKSPPNDPVVGDLSHESPLSLPSHAGRFGLSQPSSCSSPFPKARPRSFGNGYADFSPLRQQSIERHPSRSLNSPYSDYKISLPHMPRSHLYGAPEVDISRPSGQPRPYAEGSYSFCAFDSIHSPSLKSLTMGANVLLVGMDGALEVLALEDRKPRPIARLVDIQGRVVDAKLLTWTTAHDPFTSSRPHVAVIVHGPCDRPETESSVSETNDMQAKGISVADDVVFYQTRAEIYSLRSGEHISTLFTCKPVPCHETFPTLPAFAPSPTGSLRLYTSDNVVVLASGVSGEVYIYGVRFSSDLPSYQCLGKTWTSIQSRESRRYSASSNSTDPDGSHNDSPQCSKATDTPILSLRGRWLAIVSPPSTYRSSLGGSIPASLLNGKALGLETRSPTARPVVTCAVDCEEGESFFNKMARDVAQELVKGARWMGDQGMQAWNSYWSKDEPRSSTSRRAPPLVDTPVQGYSLFPPTHAHETQPNPPTEPDIVSIIDLKRLEEGGDGKHLLMQPVSTFLPPNGCSWLSFSPNGLMLLTASKKGDVQYVWDLMQSRNCRAGALVAPDEPLTGCASVWQVARYARLTTSTVVDVIWTSPTGERLAVITRKGTVHVFDLPRSAFQWPPLRRSRPSLGQNQHLASLADDQASRSATTNTLSAAIKLVGGKTQPILAAVRDRASSASISISPVSGFGLTTAAGVRSGKVVAASLSKSMGAATGTVSTLRHAGDNRLHIPGLARDPAASRATWVINKGQAYLGLIDNGVFKLYSIKKSATTQKPRHLSVIGVKEIEYKLPPYLERLCGPIPVTTFDQDSTVTACIALPSSLPHSPAGQIIARRQPLSQAEIETNAPYQPFHTDHRVNLYIFSGGAEADYPLDGNPGGSWVFGDEIAMLKLHVRPFHAGSDVDEIQEEMENLISLGNSTGHIEEVIITTRRKKKTNSRTPIVPGDDGFFEDDCEVLDFVRDRV